MTRGRHPLVAEPPGGLLWRRSGRRRYATAPETHGELVVLLGLSGRAEYLLDGRVWDLGQGSLLWAFAGQSHVLLSDTPDFDMWVVLISEDILPPGPATPGLPPLDVADTGGPVPPRAVAGADADRLGALAAEIETAEGADLRRAGLIWWLHTAWRAWQIAPDGAFRAIHPGVERAARMLREDPSLPTKDLAAAAGLSPGHLGRRFAAETGKTIPEFRTDERLHRVRNILREHPRTGLLTAALDAGFGSYAQFYRACVQRHGVAPAQHFKTEKGAR